MSVVPYCKPHHTHFLKFLLVGAWNYIPASSPHLLHFFLFFIEGRKMKINLKNSCSSLTTMPEQPLSFARYLTAHLQHSKAEYPALSTSSEDSFWNWLCDTQRVYHLHDSLILPRIELPNVMPFRTKSLISQYLQDTLRGHTGERLHKHQYYSVLKQTF